jgi:hypothetical protein
MSNAQNLSYAVVQILHNFGAVSTVAGSLAAIRVAGADVKNKLAWLVFAGWGIQALSGAAFGLISFLFYHQFPDIAGIALTSLVIKILCVATGFLLLAAYLLRAKNWSDAARNYVWISSAMLAVIAISLAAFLRWFS